MKPGERIKILPGEPGPPPIEQAGMIGVITDVDKFVMGFVGVHLDGEDVIRAFHLNAVQVLSD